MIQMPKDVITLIELLNKEGYEGYLVGGCVRDIVYSAITNINVEPHDYDLCTNARPDEIEAVLKKNGLGIVTTGKKFGTITAMIDGEGYEITTYRKETGYSDGRHPDTVEFADSIEDDLKRRDFTINAMAYNPVNDELIDCFGGISDLAKGYIEAVGRPYDRFHEDGLRILRAMRFAINFNFKISPHTFNAMVCKDNLEILKSISKERITEEFKKILTSGKPIRKQFLKCDEVVFACIDNFKPCYKFEQNNKYHRHDVYEHCLSVVDGCDSKKFEIKLAALLHDIGKPDCYIEDENGAGHFYGHPEVSYELCKDILKNDFRLTKEEESEILDLVKNHDISVESTKQAVKRFLNKYGEDFCMDWLVLKQADIDDHIFPEPEKVNYRRWVDKDYVLKTIAEIKAEKACFSLKDLAVNGHDLMALGLKGKEIGNALNLLLNKVIDEDIPNDKENLISYIDSDVLQKEDDIELD